MTEVSHGGQKTEKLYLWQMSTSQLPKALPVQNSLKSPVYLDDVTNTVLVGEEGMMMM
jgi:hypothetical protein